MAYTVFESVNMKSTRGAEFILDAVSDKDVENGTFGYLDGLVEGETHVYNFVNGTAVGKQVVVADNPAWDEDTCRKTNQRKDKYIIPAGVRFRVRVVAMGDTFGISIDGVTEGSRDKMVKDAFVTIDTSGKLIAANVTTTDAVMEAVVERIRSVGGAIVAAAHTYGHKYKMYECKINQLV